jgi:carbonic anhydrase
MSIERRTFLKYAVAGCACCMAPRFADAVDHAAPHWSYEGATGPEHWGELSPDFKVCQAGLQQTPIDLSSAMKGDASIAVDYRPFPLRVVNNGHTIQAAASGGNAIAIEGTRYDLAQFHFHHPSEHLLDGVAFDMEAHLVHKSAEGRFAVVGVFMKAGAHNDALDVVFNYMPLVEGGEVLAPKSFDPSVLLPANRSGFRYMGSLTTPPCSEGLVWTVFREPIEVSPEQIRRFALLFPNNARPVQHRNDRLLVGAGRV